MHLPITEQIWILSVFALVWTGESGYILSSKKREYSLVVFVLEPMKFWPGRISIYLDKFWYAVYLL